MYNQLNELERVIEGQDRLGGTTYGYRFGVSDDEVAKWQRIREVGFKLEKRLWFAAFARDEMPAFQCPHRKEPKLALVSHEQSNFLVSLPGRRVSASPEMQPRLLCGRWLELLRSGREALILRNHQEGDAAASSSP